MLDYIHMGLRKNIGSYAIPIISTKAAITAGLVVLIAGAVIALLRFPGV